MDIIARIVGAVFNSIVTGALRYFREKRVENNLLKLGWQQSELDRAGVSRAARQKARERERDVLQLTMEQIVDINRRGAAALDGNGVRDADVEDGDKPAVPVVG